jgi:hypothetical protein
MLNRRKFFSVLPLSTLGLVVPEAKADEPRLTHPLTGYPMTIGEWRDRAMVYRDAVERLITEKESIWVEMTCQHEAHYEWKQGINGEWIQGAMTHPACGQKFKVLRVPTTPICPKCGYSQDINRPGIREQFQGQPC